VIPFMRRCAECHTLVAIHKVKVTLKGQVLKSLHLVSAP
jgi:hypothetical protein